MSQSDQIESVQSEVETASPATEQMIAGIYEALHNVYDPELGVNVVDLDSSTTSICAKTAS